MDDVIDAGQEVLTRRTRRWAVASVGLVAAAAMVAGGVLQGSAKTSQVPASTPSAANAATLVLDLNDVVPGRPAKLQVRTKDVPGATEAELAGLAEQMPAILVDTISVRGEGAPVKGVQRLSVQLSLAVLRKQP